MFWRKKSTQSDDVGTAMESSVVLKLGGLHCTSCSLLVDNTLEDLPGVISSSTSYAKSECRLVVSPQKFHLDSAISALSALGYQVVS